VTVHEYIIPHVLVCRQHNGDDQPQDNNLCFLALCASVGY